MLSRQRLEHIISYIKSTQCGPCNDYFVGTLSENWSDEMLAAPNWDYRNPNWKGVDFFYNYWETPDAKARALGLWQMKLVPLSEKSWSWMPESKIEPGRVAEQLVDLAKKHGYLNLDLDATSEDGKRSSDHVMCLVYIDQEFYIADSYVNQRSFELRPFDPAKLRDFLEVPTSKHWSELCACADSGIIYYEYMLMAGYVDMP